MDIFDINYRILQQQHPYYSSELCKTNSYIRESCDASKYDLLQLWCYPERSVFELKTSYPNITFSDVIEMTLVYHPIPESRGKYDDLTLFYHSCRIGQDQPTMFIPQITSENDITYAIMFICYKYNRIDVLEYWRNNLSSENLRDFLNIMINAIHSKLGISKYEDLQTGEYYSSNNIMKSSMLFDEEELLELCLNLANGGSHHMIRNLGSRNDTTDTRAPNPGSFINTLISIIGIDKAIPIIKRYRPNLTSIQDILTSEGSRFIMNARSRSIMKGSVLSRYEPFPYDIVKINRNKYSKLRDGVKYLTTAQVVFNDSLIKDALTDDQLSIYYITTGKFDQYILLKDINGPITKVEERNIKRFAIPNLYGIISLNSDLSRLLNIDLSMMDQKSIPYIIELSKIRNIPISIYKDDK